jgi:hypothetical protein
LHSLLPHLPNKTNYHQFLCVFNLYSLLYLAGWFWKKITPKKKVKPDSWTEQDLTNNTMCCVFAVRVTLQCWNWVCWWAFVMTACPRMCVCVFVCLYEWISVSGWWVVSDFYTRLLGGWVTYAMVLQIKPLYFYHKFTHCQSWTYMQEDMLYAFFWCYIWTQHWCPKSLRSCEDGHWGICSLWGLRVLISQFLFLTLDSCNILSEVTVNWCSYLVYWVIIGNIMPLV